MNFTTPYNSTDYFFTKEEDEIIFNSPLDNTYFKMEVTIITYEFYTQKPKLKTLKYKIPLFEKKASFNLGEIIDRAMPRIKEVKLKNLLQYRATEVTILILEVDIATDVIISGNSIGPVKFISGYKPEVVENNCAFLDVYQINRSISKNGFAFFNMVLTVGTHIFKVLKNGKEVDSFEITIVGTNICSYILKMEDYEANQGDKIKIIMPSNPTLYKMFHVFPTVTPYSNLIAFEDEFRLLSFIEFTGEYRFPLDFATKFNKILLATKTYNNKVSSTKELSFICNTGFVLQEEEFIIESLLDSLKAWLIIGENKVIELVTNAKKFVKQDPTTELYYYDVEFYVNPQIAKPTKLEMDTVIDDIAFTPVAIFAPLNLTATNTTDSYTFLQWEINPDETETIVLFDIYKNGEYLASTNELYYEVNELEIDTTYSFSIKAKSAVGQISVNSNIINVETNSSNDSTPPSVPLFLTSTDISYTTIKLSWNASVDDNGVSKYNIYKDGVKVGESTGTTYVVKGLSQNTSYNFYVNASDPSGNTSANSIAINRSTQQSELTPFYMTYWGVHTGGVDCDATKNTLRWHDGTGEYPVSGDTIFSDPDTVFTYTNSELLKFGIPDNKTISIYGASGVVTSVGSCGKIKL